MNSKLHLILFALLVISAFHSCKKEDVDPDIENFLTPSSNTKLFQAEFHSLLYQVDNNKIILLDTGNIGFFDSLKSGDILVSAPNEVANYGFLRKVTSVQRQAGQVILTTEHAYLDEAFIDGYIKFDAVLDPSDTIRSLDFTIDSERIIYDYDGNENTTNDQIRAGGSLTANLEMGFEFNLRKKTFKVESEASLGGTVNFLWELNSIAGKNLSLEKEMIFKSWQLRPILIQVGFWPVTISPYVDIVGKLNGELKGVGKINATVSANTNGYVKYDDGWDSGAEGDLEIVPVIGAAAESEIKLALGPQVKFQPYDMDFVEGTIHLFAYGKGNGSAGTSGVECGLVAGMEFGAKTRLDFYKIFRNVKFEGTLNIVEELIWKCPETMTDPRDGHKYPIKEIGSKIWMIKNLNYDAPGSWCYGNDSTNCLTYGRLYSWEEAMSACPEGWHLPSVEEWKEICQLSQTLELVGDPYEIYVGSSQNLIENLSFGFEPGGIFNSALNGFEVWGDEAIYWSSTKHPSGTTACKTIFRKDGGLSISGPGGPPLNFPLLTDGLSCRCVKD